MNFTNEPNVDNPICSSYACHLEQTHEIAQLPSQFVISKGPYYYYSISSSFCNIPRVFAVVRQAFPNQKRISIRKEKQDQKVDNRRILSNGERWLY
jgi:hypothetical protein